MIRKTRCLILLATLLGLVGCAMNTVSNTDVAQMTYQHQTTRNPRNIMMKNNVSVVNVLGSSGVNPLWKSQIDSTTFKTALEQSLQASNLYHPVSGARYQLTATLVKLDQPMPGNTAVVCRVHYQLGNIKTQKLMYDQDIVSSFSNMKNLPQADELAAKMNIQKLIEKLYRLPVARS